MVLSQSKAKVPFASIGSKAFWLLLGLVIASLGIGSVALTMELMRPPTLFSRSFVIGVPFSCMDGLAGGRCSEYNFSVPGNPGGVRLVTLRATLNTSCFTCDVGMSNYPRPPPSAFSPGCGEGFWNASAECAALMSPGNAFVKVYEGGCSVPGQNPTVNCTLPAVKVSVVITDLGTPSW